MDDVLRLASAECSAVCTTALGCNFHFIRPQNVFALHVSRNLSASSSLGSHPVRVLAPCTRSHILIQFEFKLMYHKMLKDGEQTFMCIAHVGPWCLLLSILPVLFTAYSYSCLADSRFRRGSCLVTVKAVLHMQLVPPTGNKSNSSSTLDLQI